MKNKMIYLFTIIALLLVSIAPKVDAASQLADGTYTINYTILKGDNDSASMANDYFLKPATLNVKNGTIQVQIKIKQSNWIKELSINGSPVKIVSQDQTSDTRVIQFSASDLTKPILSKMHVLIEDYNYDNKYTVRFSFDMSSLKGINVAAAPTETKAATPTEKSTSTAKANNATTKHSEAVSNSKEVTADTNVKSQSKAEANPKTGDSTEVGILIVMLISALFLAYKMKAKSQ
ncbi:heme uptake protein IsdC [Peribacillus loiseleuriae]|uniref:NEAT domain-containing protein n=1 Tax=Peribacillus loiseleuriae TaxID=1679170 RepID=A0A0K9GYY9_9BACI|nr:heme uptake protein IsdC [Peribacillus loiseleuriae]KMY51467.1 hypothetical protein AC625_19570 [Peribacillus loiseleuriae]